MYSEKVLNIFSNLECFGEVKRPSASGLFKSELTGDIIKFTIKIEDGKIVDARFKAFGSVATLVVAEKTCELLTYKYIVDVKKITAHDILAQVGTLPKNKQDVCQNSIMAIKNLIENYEKKEAKRLKQAINEGNVNI